MKQACAGMGLASANGVIVYFGGECTDFRPKSANDAPTMRRCVEIMAAHAHGALI